MQITTTKQAIDIIVRMGTLPPQIDYIKPSEHQACNQAEEFIERLNSKERDLARQSIEEQLNAYTDDSDGPSPAYYDSLF